VIPAIAGLRFRLQTGRLAPDNPDVARRKAAGEDVLGILNDRLSERDFLVAGRYSIADIAVYAHTHVAHEAGYELTRRPAVQAWLRRVAEQAGYVNDLEPYPANARPGAGHSIYD
jgi:glutathione S-transferase